MLAFIESALKHEREDVGVCVTTRTTEKNYRLASEPISLEFGNALSMLFTSLFVESVFVGVSVGVCVGVSVGVAVLPGDGTGVDVGVDEVGTTGVFDELGGGTPVSTVLAPAT